MKTYKHSGTLRALTRASHARHALHPLLFLLWASAAVLADPIPIVNADFELLTGADTNHFGSDGKLRISHFAYELPYPEDPERCYITPDPAPGWRINSPHAGTHRYSTNDFPSRPPTDMALFVNASEPPVEIAQTLCRVLTPGTYTLTVEVGRRSQATYPGSYRVQLLAGNCLIAEDFDTQYRTPGAFVTSMSTVTIYEGHPCLGAPLEIRLAGLRPEPYSQITFDNVRLEGPPGPCLTVRPAVGIAWASETNRIYRIQWSSNFASGSWKPLEVPALGEGSTNLVPGSGTTSLVFDSIHGRERRFYRCMSDAPWQAGAVPLPVVNPGFEALTGTDPSHFGPDGRLLENHFTMTEDYDPPSPLPVLAALIASDAIPGWKVSGRYAGTFHPQPTHFLGGVPEGQNTAYLGIPEAGQVVSISQVLWHVLVPGTYTLQVDAGLAAFAESMTFQIELRAGPDFIISTGGRQTQPSAGFFTVSNSVTIPDNHPRLGARLIIRLSTFHDGFSGQAHFDNVRLSGPPGPCLDLRPATEVAWTSESSKSYRVFWKSDSAIDYWTPLEIFRPWIGTTNLIAGNGSTNAVFNAANDCDPRHYRVMEVRE